MPRRPAPPRPVPHFVPPPPPGARAVDGRSAASSTPAAAAATERIRLVVRNAQQKLLESRKKLRAGVEAARTRLRARSHTR